MKKVPIVNEKDRIVGHKTRKEADKFIYRVAALWITDHKENILLAKRAKTKSHDPGRWGTAVSGTVEKGETYRQNIIKESYEELGLKDIRPKKGPKIRRTEPYHYFVQWYLLKLDKEISEFTVNRKEVSEIRWFTKKELKQEIRQHPERFGKQMRRYVKEFCL